ncbi:hypothetical protein SCA6_006386 [Theobroma cacao]
MSGGHHSMDSRYIHDDGPDNPPTASIPGPLFLAARTYQLSPLEDLALATMLVRPNRLFSVNDKSRELVLTSEKYGTVNWVFIAAEYDLIYEEGVRQWMIQQNQPDQVEEIKGSDHMVMMCKPIELFNLLLSIAMKYKSEEGKDHFAV